MYLDEIAAEIRSYIPENSLPEEDFDDLLRSYSVLLLAKGTGVQNSDIHDAWAAWMARSNPDHDALVPYSDLPPDIREQDAVFTAAVRQAAIQLKPDLNDDPEFSAILFPNGFPSTDAEKAEVLDLYKVMVASSESLVGRRQAVNTFFLTANGALLTGYGLILKTSEIGQWSVVGLVFLAIAGVILSTAWKSLIDSFGQLNTGKFKVINSIERHLPAAIYEAEWVALGEGHDPKIYRSFTSREVWVPRTLVIVHSLIAVISVVVLVSLGLRSNSVAKIFEHIKALVAA